MTVMAMDGQSVWPDVAASTGDSEISTSAVVLAVAAVLTAILVAACVYCLVLRTGGAKEEDDGGGDDVVKRRGNGSAPSRRSSHRSSRASFRSDGSRASLRSFASRESRSSTVQSKTNPLFRPGDDWVIGGLDTPSFTGLDYQVQPHSVVPKAVRSKKYNRYMDILPSKRAAVILPKLAGDPASAYINASFIHGWNGGKREYIAAMGPKRRTVTAFARMIWHWRVPTVVMVTRLRENGEDKCRQYWDVPTGAVKVTNLGEEARGSGYTISRLRVASDGDTREVMHLWYKAWPDHGVPKNIHDVLMFLREIRRYHQPDKGPLLVHCSAGVGAFPHVLCCVSVRRKLTSACAVLLQGARVL